MPAYLLTLPDTAAQLVEGKLNAIVFAESAAAAKVAAPAGYYSSFINGVPPYFDAMFAAATATEIVARSDLEGAILRVQVPGAPTPIDVSVTGEAAATVDTIGAAMVTAFNLDAQIAGAAYDGSNLLTVSDIADALGDLALTVTFTLDGEDLSGFVGAIVDEGIAGAVLTVQLATDAIALPNVVATF